MSENNHNNDPFEQFFRDKAGDYKIPYREEDWLKLEKKLDVKDVQAAYRRKQRWILAASVLIISMLAYFTYQNHNRLNQLSRQLAQEQIAGDNEPSVGPAPGDSSETDEDRGMETRNGFAETNWTDPPAAISPGDLAEESPIALAESEKRAGIVYRETGEIFTENSLKGQVVNAEYPASKVKEVHISPAEPSSIQQTDSVAIREPFLAMKQNDAAAPKASKVSMGLLLSPDFSTAGSLSDFYEPGYKIGFMIEYRLGPNFAVSAGALQSEVRYTAPGENYNPPARWNAGISPDEVTGVCLLIDLPVTLNYSFMNFSRSRFYVTAGFSSYIMLNEDYQFSYEEGGSGLNENWTGKTGTRHWMSNASFSIGYELDLHPNWSLRAEPFIKVPVREVGWGNVKLYSVGSFVSINYNFL